MSTLVDQALALIPFCESLGHSATANVLRQLADRVQELEGKGEPVHPNHRSDLRYVLATLNDCNANLKMKAELRERVQASIVGMRYVISRTEADPVQPEKEERRPLTEPELRHVLDGTNNMVRNAMRGPFWPELEEACRAIEAAHRISPSPSMVGREGEKG